MKKVIVIACLLFIGFSATAQKADSAYKQKVVELMKIQSGQLSAMDQVMDKMSANIPDEKKAAFKKEINNVMNEMYDKIADIYIEVYTKKEIDAMFDFYNSPMGKEIQKKIPQVTEETMKMSQSMGQKLAPIIQKYMGQ